MLKHREGAGVEHAAGITTVVRAVKAEFPDLAIEAHDRIGGGLPLYYQHGSALQPWLARGRFVGIDRFTHLHVLEDGGAVLTAFNLTARPVRRTAGLVLADLSLGPAPAVTGAPSALADGVLTIDLDLPPLSPVVVEIDTSR